MDLKIEGTEAIPYKKNTPKTLITFSINASWNTKHSSGWLSTDFCRLRMIIDQVSLQSPLLKGVAQEKWPQES